MTDHDLLIGIVLLLIGLLTVAGSILHVWHAYECRRLRRRR